DCINVRQREKAKEARFAADMSLLTSPAICRMPPNCGALPVQSRRSPLRQTACWRKADSNSQSHLERNSYGWALRAIPASRSDLKGFGFHDGIRIDRPTEPSEKWDRRFESGLLQRGVRHSPGALSPWAQHG